VGKVPGADDVCTPLLQLERGRFTGFQAPRPIMNDRCNLMVTAPRRGHAMPNSRQARFAWSKEDRFGDEPFFRLLRRNWRPLMRRVGNGGRLSSRDRDGAYSSMKTPAHKPGWSPWLWIGS
jgi:hypothetical protein